jgi:hypothetical protein
MHGRPPGSRKAIACCVLGATVLLASCTGSPGSGPAGPVTSGNVITSAGTAGPACPSGSDGISGFATSPGLGAGSQLVLGRISVQTGYVGMPVPVQGPGPWRYWQKRGILILAGTAPVQVSVPSSWRQRAAVTYGTTGIVSSLVLTACRHPAGVWDAYAGGIYLRAATPCVPLVFATGNRNITVRFSTAGPCS